MRVALCDSAAPHFLVCVCVMSTSLLQPTRSENHQWTMRFAKNFSGDSSDSGDEKGTDRRSTQTLMVRQCSLFMR